MVYTHWIDRWKKSSCIIFIHENHNIYETGLAASLPVTHPQANSEEFQLQYTTTYVVSLYLYLVI